MYCLKCDQSYEKIYGIKQTHCPKCTDSLLYKCLKCPKRYRNYCDMTVHLKYDCNKLKSMQCSFCSYKTNRRARLTQHTKKVHLFTKREPAGNPANQEYKCSGCHKSFTYLRHLRSHQHHQCSVTYFCSKPNCSFKTIYPHSLAEHVSSIHERDENLTYTCRKCARVFRSKNTLKSHLSTNCGKEPSIRCAHCDYVTYSTYPRMAIHMQRKHKELYPKDAFQCRYCKKDLHCYYEVNRHLKVAEDCRRKEAERLYRKQLREDTVVNAELIMEAKQIS